MRLFSGARRFAFRGDVGLFALLAFAALMPRSAESSPLPPETKIKLTVVQWIPTKGVYEQWGSLGGEYTVSEEKTIVMPVLGSIQVGDLDNAGLAAEIGIRLKDKIGLVETPATLVEVLQYAPIYVVGDVAKPGEYTYHPRLSVLQALAMSGGEIRSVDGLQNSLDVTKLVGELKELDDSIIRSGAKIERLQAEMSGAKVLDFEKQPGNTDQFTAAIYNQEKAIFAARANALDRKTKSLSELLDLLTEEIHVLDEKTKSTDANIKSMQQQVDSIATLVSRGAVVATRQGEVERVLRSYQDNRLDIVTAIMRARQSISQTTRDLQGVADERQTEVASALQSERALIVQLKLKRETSQKLMLDNLSQNGAQTHQSEKLPLIFSIVRRDDGKMVEVGASETTALLPGDVIKVSRQSSQASMPTAPASSDDGHPDRASQ
ncbi:hypothetical protein [Rhizobium sp. Root1220]|uniref:hypothetical protein n=1 Tax=Rhizobium sp. Root1220 TaxID=1736432 RepID=UPI0006FF9EF4|nr:hypothetical protein [Rhizobium sp. Root1220]KQV70302.1 exopolysaccharide biosynthesis protein [Rhizobium sp. Root1220]